MRYAKILNRVSSSTKLQQPFPAITRERVSVCTDDEPPRPGDP